MSTFSLRLSRRTPPWINTRFACAEVSRSSTVLIGTTTASFSAATNVSHFFRRRAVAAVHVARQADEDQVNFLFADQLPEPRQKIRERLGGNVFQRLRDGFGFIAHRDADAFASVIEGEDSHDAHSFAINAWRGEPISIALF